MVKLLRQILILVRPEHWVKNLFVFIPAFFAAKMSDMPVLLATLTGFLSFCLIASAVYTLNDMVDAKEDRNHPDKCKRPLASGAMKRSEAIVVLSVLLLGGTSLAASLSWEALLIALLYFTINVFYSFGLKHIAIIDIALIGLGFLLRVFMGGAAAGVPVSQWLIVLTFLIALILGLAKRRGEYVIATNGLNFRKALEGYNMPFLDASMVVCSTVAIVAYIMYCFSPEVTTRIGSDKIFYTAFFVVLGVLRYLQLTLVYNKTESPTRALLRDAFLQIVLLMWIGAFCWLLYMRKWM
jgi:4-hydroxybenzoate polyprenyltransferase